MPIRWDKELERKLEQAVNNYNHKVARINKAKRAKILKYESGSEIKQKYLTRKELNRKIESLERLNQRNSEIITNKAGVSKTKYEWDELERNLKRSKRFRTLQWKKLEEREKDRPDWSLKSNRYEQTKHSRQALDTIDLMNSDEERMEAVERTLRKEEFYNYNTKRFYDEFFSRLTESQDLAHVDAVLIESLKNKLQSVDPNTFLEIYNEEEYLRSIMEYVETKGFRKQMTGYRGNKSKLAVPEEDFNGILRALNSKLPALIQKYG